MILSITDRDVFHLHEGGDSQSMLSRYGFLSPDKGGDEKNACTVEGETVTLNTRRTLTVTAEKKTRAFFCESPLPIRSACSAAETLPETR